jgi:hypothetical protein
LVARATLVVIIVVFIGEPELISEVLALLALLGALIGGLAHQGFVLLFVGL